jgi:uncharacterized membrane protein YcaP (DUF421 family)
MEQSITPLDFQRMLLGNLPWLFLLEIVVRTAVMYLYALLMVRFMGKRGQRQLSPFDFLVIIALGSAVGDPMFYSEVPMLPGMVVLATVVTLERLLSYAIHGNEWIEEFVSGVPRRLVCDGRLDIDNVKQETFSREEIFTMLRAKGVTHLGEVERAYIEQTGELSTYKYSQAEIRPGLAIAPPWEIEAPTTYSASTTVPAAGYYACTACGDTVRLDHGELLSECQVCEGQKWTRATHRPAESRRHI